MNAPEYWRTRHLRHTLVGAECPVCGVRFATARLVCPQCGREVSPLVPHVFPTIAAQVPAHRDAKPVITVIIPSYNASFTIRDTLSSVMTQDISAPYEVIVVDSSSDGTESIIAEEFSRVQLVHCTEQTDPGTARNLGIARAGGEIIACLDADCIAPVDWLRRMLAAQRAGHLIVGGAVRNAVPTSLISWAGYLGEFREFVPFGEARLVKHVPTCNISYHRSIFARFGGFPTRFYPQEDLLYHWRIAQHGVSIWFDPNTCVRHVHRSAWRAYGSHQRRIGRITAQVLKLTHAEGVFLVRFPVLATLVAPLLPLVKWLRTIAMFRSRQPRMLHEHLWALAPLLLGLCAWAVGFVEGAWSPPLSVSQPKVS